MPIPSPKYYVILRATLSCQVAMLFNCVETGGHSQLILVHICHPSYCADV